MPPHRSTLGAGSLGLVAAILCPRSRNDLSALCFRGRRQLRKHATEHSQGALPRLGAFHDPSDPMGKMFFNILATFAEFEADLIRMRTREGSAVARAKGKAEGQDAEAVGPAPGRAAPHVRRGRALDQRPRRGLRRLAPDGLPGPPARAGPDCGQGRQSPVADVRGMTPEGRLSGTERAFAASRMNVRFDRDTVEKLRWRRNGSNF